MLRHSLFIVSLTLCAASLFAQKGSKKAPAPALAVSADTGVFKTADYFKPVRWRNIGPFRGGRSVAACGVRNNPLLYYMGTTGGGLWKTEDAGMTWQNISDGFFKTGSVGAVAVSESEPAVLYVGMGEHAPRGVMTSYGDGVWKSADAGKTWTYMGLDKTRHISWIRIHPKNADIVYVGAQGALHGPGTERGVYKSKDGGQTWERILYVNEDTGCADLAMDPDNPRILYAAMWDHRRLPWEVRSGGQGSGIYKSTDSGNTWTRLTKGLPDKLGKISVSVSPVNTDKVWVLAESDTEKESGGLFVSNDGGESFSKASGDHRLTQRAWYYIEVFADTKEENTVYVLNSPGLKSTDNGKTWTNIRGTHGDYHQLWIHPDNNKNMVIANDGGAAITFNGGKTWSAQNTQPTAQMYRVNADNLFPYNVYGGQQDNSSVRIASRNVTGGSITDRDFTYSAGGESAFLAFNPDNPRYVMGGSYQGTVELLDSDTKEGRLVMVAPIQYQALQPKDMKYRFNWNAPIMWSKHEPDAFYHAGNHVFKTTDQGKNWQIISPDLTRNDRTKQGVSGVPYTNEGAGGENYGTIAYLTDSPHEKGTLYAGSDDGLVHLTRDGGANWKNVTPAGLEECLVNCIEVSPHDPATVYIATTRYKVNDFAPGLYKSSDYGRTWMKIVNGIPDGAYTRCIREDQGRKGLLFAGTETGLYVSFNAGSDWEQLQLGLPVTPITDLKVHRGDLLAATMGRSFWILDDLHLLRQYDAAAAPDRLHLFQPEDAYRTSGYGATGDDTDTKPRKGATSGQNAPGGIVLYYQLPKNTKTDTLVTLTIKNSEGKTVRQFSSKADPHFEDYPGGPDAEPLLSVKAGLNKFIWDMRYATIPGVPTVFIEGSYQGHRAIPGRYSAELSIGNEKRSVGFSILPHPLLTATPAEYAEQDAWQTKVEEECAAIHRTVVNTRKIRKQIESLNKVWEKEASAADMVKSGKALAEKMQAWEDKLVQNKAQSNDDIINYVNRLSADYIFLKGEMDTNIPHITQGHKQQYQALHTMWEGLQKELDTLKKEDLGAYIDLCKKSGIPAVGSGSE